MCSIEVLARKFYDTFYAKTWSGPLSPDIADLSIDDAYRVQDLVVDMRVDCGETVVGYKVGCTSPAIRAQFGLSEPIRARLWHPYIYEEGVELDWADYVGCAIEPEMVIKIGRIWRVMRCLAMS